MKYHDYVKIIYSLIDLENHVIGVKLLKTEDEYNASDANIPKKSINYCGMVKAAYKGHKIKALEETFRCQSGPRVLGINPLDLKNSNGENWARLNLYESRELSKSVRESLYYLKEKNYGVEVKPIEYFEDIPDVIIFITNPYNCMRILQGYSYKYGVANSLQILGNQAICYELTSRVYSTKDINISMLCIGTRHRADWDENLMGISIHSSKFLGLVDGLINTVNRMESDNKKKIIEKKLKNNHLDILNIRYGYNYYKDV